MLRMWRMLGNWNVENDDKQISKGKHTKASSVFRGDTCTAGPRKGGRGMGAVGCSKDKKLTFHWEGKHACSRDHNDNIGASGLGLRWAGRRRSLGKTEFKLLYR